MTNPKRHHYLPQFYLKGFCRNEYLWVYDRTKNEIRRQTPVNTAIQTYYYSVEDENGQKNPEIESFLAQIEGSTKPIIDKLALKEKISYDDKDVLSIFIAFLMNRVPDFEKSINKIEGHFAQKILNLMFSDDKRAESIMKRYEKETGDTLEISAKDLVKFYKSKEYTIDIHRNESLRLMMELSMPIANIFRQMEWVFFHAPQKAAFVTTDNPVFTIPPDDWDPNSFYSGVGIITRGAKKMVPLTQKICLVMYDLGERILHNDLNRDHVRRLNTNITCHTDRFVIGRDKALVRSLTKATKLDEWERKGRIQIVEPSIQHD